MNPVRATHGSEDRPLGVIEALKRPAAFSHPVIEFEIVETHISYVLLTGAYAYKFKKPVDLGFLDFSSLPKRKFFIEEELRLNRRLAPSLYLDIVPVTGTEDKPMLAGPGPVIEYALKMVQFPAGAQLDRLLARDGLRPDMIDDLALEIAGFHQHARIADPTSSFGQAQQICEAALANFDTIAAQNDDPDLNGRIARLRAWTEKQGQSLVEAFSSRKRQGWVRECHGDMHLSNMVLVDGQVTIFDCIEFSEALRFIDVQSDLAFLLMDLDYRDQRRVANRLLNRYLEHTGDYAGLRVLDFYQAYRSMVRAKVAEIARRQATDAGVRREAAERVRRHLMLAEAYAEDNLSPSLTITHGLSGSGKTALTEDLLEHSGAVRVRSDVERKRLRGLPPGARSGSGPEAGLYDPGMTARTYERLVDLAASILEQGYPVLVDAVFLKRSQREAFYRLAQKRNVPFRILDLKASPDTLRARIAQRERKRSDASEAGLNVLSWQLERDEPLSEAEQHYALTLDTDRGLDLVRIAEVITTDDHSQSGVPV